MSGHAIALNTLARNLRVCFRERRPQGYQEGKRRIVEVVMRFYDCTPRVARKLVKDLESKGFIYARGASNALRRKRKPEDAIWHFQAEASA